jgi:hypothetical protein
MFQRLRGAKSDYRNMSCLFLEGVMQASDPVLISNFVAFPFKVPSLK